MNFMANIILLIRVQGLLQTFYNKAVFHEKIEFLINTGHMHQYQKVAPIYHFIFKKI